MIPKRFIRIWLGKNLIPHMFQKWWDEFKEIHPDYEFVTITDYDRIKIPDTLISIYNNVGSYAGRSDILRIIILYNIGGIYIDTDIMPIKSFDTLLDKDMPFIGLRSGKSFESAVIGSPAKHKALSDLIDALPKWYSSHIDNAASVQTGPAFISSVWFGRDDIQHLPKHYFYPYNGFMAPKRSEKINLFKNKNNFNSEMYCAHFSNHRWGGKPTNKIK